MIKKKGLLNSTAKHGNVVGEGHAYLKSPMWWTGMTLMIIGEVSGEKAVCTVRSSAGSAMGIGHRRADTTTDEGVSY